MDAGQQPAPLLTFEAAFFVATTSRQQDPERATRRWLIEMQLDNMTSSYVPGEVLLMGASPLMLVWKDALNDPAAFEQLDRGMTLRGKLGLYPRQPGTYRFDDEPVPDGIKPGREIPPIDPPIEQAKLSEQLIDHLVEHLGIEALVAAVSARAAAAAPAT